MKKLIFILAIFLLNLYSKGQETKKIVKYYPKSKQIMEEYFVYENKEYIKHGQYKKYFRSRNGNFKKSAIPIERLLEVKGYYFENKKDSTWTYYINDSKHSFKKEENYRKGEKVGIWLTALEKGKVIQRYNFETNKYIEPIIELKIDYPYEARELGISGIVEVYVRYNPDCTLDTIYVSKPVNEIIDNGAYGNVSQYENFKQKYSFIKDCSAKTDTTYVINYILNY